MCGCAFALRGCLTEFLNMGMLPCFDLHTDRILGLIFRWEIKGFWTRVLHVNSSYISELDVRLLNHQNRTSTAQVMVHFPRLPQFGLFICYVRILGLISVLILY